MIYSDYVREKTHNLTKLKIAEGSPCIFDKALKKPLKNYKVYGNTTKNRLPDEYQEVEYIETTGQQWIDLGIVDMTISNTKAEYVAQINSDADGNKRVFTYGAVADNTNFTGWENRTGYYISTLGKEVFLPSSTSVQKHKIVMNRRGRKANFFINDNLTHSYTGTFQESSQILQLFGYTANSQAYQGKLWYLKFWQGKTILYDMIPCYRKSDNEIGMYNLVDHKFYTNKGTVAFIKGPEIVPTLEQPVVINSCGDLTKNIYNYRVNSYNVSLKEDGTLFKVNGDQVSNFISVKPNTIYTVSMTGSRRGKFFDANKNVIDSTAFQFDATHKTATFKTTPDTHFIRFAMSNALETVDFKKVVAQEGFYEYEYVPYNKYKIDIISGINLNYESFIQIGYTNGWHSKTIVTPDMVGKTVEWSLEIDNTQGLGIAQAKMWYYNQQDKLDYGGAGTELEIGEKGIAKMIFTITPDMKSICYGFQAGKRDEYTESKCIIIKTSAYILEDISRVKLFLDEPLRKISIDGVDSISDYIDFKNQKIVRNIGSEVFDGSVDEEWTKWKYPTNRIGFYCPMKKYSKFFQKESVGINNLLPISKDAYLAEYNNSYFGSNGNEIDLITAKFATDVNALKQYLSSNNLKVLFVLKTPIEEPIELPQIKSLKGHNEITTDTLVPASNIWVKYMSR